MRYAIIGTPITLDLLERLVLVESVSGCIVVADFTHPPAPIEIKAFRNEMAISLAANEVASAVLLHPKKKGVPHWLGKQRTPFYAPFQHGKRKRV